jgi:hypothetical protein
VTIATKARSFRRFVALSVVVASTAAVFMFALPHGALACSLSGAHCYAVVDYIAADYKTGGLSWLKTDRLTPQSSSNFSTNEIWVCTGATECADSWVEQGWRIGRRDGDSRTGLTWFAAEDKISQMCFTDEYVEYYDITGAVFLGSEYAAKISHSGNGRWGFYRAGFFLMNSSPCHNYNTLRMQSGSETTTASAQITGRTADLQKRAQDGVSWSYNWGNSFLYRPGPSNPLSIVWITQYQSARYSAN